MDGTKSTRRKHTQRDYGMGFKLAVVRQVEKGDLTYKQAQREYGIQGRSTVLVWLRKHGLSEDKRGCIEIQSVDDYLKCHQLWGSGGVLLHEFCHAFHNKCCEDGYDNREVLQVI